MIPEVVVGVAQEEKEAEVPLLQELEMTAATERLLAVTARLVALVSTASQEAVAVAWQAAVAAREPEAMVMRTAKGAMVVVAPATEAAMELAVGSPLPHIPAPPAQRSAPYVTRQAAAASPLSLCARRTPPHSDTACCIPPQTALRTCAPQLPAAQPRHSPTPRSHSGTPRYSSRCGHTPPPHPPPTSPAASPTATHPAGRAGTGRC